jgi:tRNA (mo5U34)-methyltransferase
MVHASRSIQEPPIATFFDKLAALGGHARGGKPGKRVANREDTQSRIDSVYWYHEFDFGDGLAAKTQIPNPETHRTLWAFIERHLDTVDFNGKSVLDLGCWDGYWSFYAERRGARSVWATDDATQHKGGDTGLRLAHELLASKVTVRSNVSVYDLSSVPTQFDVILFLGLYYHLIDPFYALMQLRKKCDTGSLVVIEGDVLHQVHPGTVFLSDDLAVAPRFVPSEHAIETLIRAAYFSIETTALCPTPFPEGDQGPVTHRRLYFCRPFTGINSVYTVPPPFGLKAYDERWGQGSDAR